MLLVYSIIKKKKEELVNRIRNYLYLIYSAVPNPRPSTIWSMLYLPLCRCVYGSRIRYIKIYFNSHLVYSCDSSNPTVFTVPRFFCSLTVLSNPFSYDIVTPTAFILKSLASQYTLVTFLANMPVLIS